MRRKKKDTDIYRILMLPLITMFLLNIGLVATTWAWYTASVSSGVNTIKAGAQVTVCVKDENDNEIERTNGKYVLPQGNNTIQLRGGSATTGYVVLMDIEDGNTTGTANSILDFIFTPVYAESKKYATEVNCEENKTIKINLSSEKTLSITNMWKEEGTNLTQGYGTLSTDNSINLTRSYTINLLNENGDPLTQSEVMNNISTYSDNIERDQVAVITMEDSEETEITMPFFDGYELISVNGEDPKESYFLTEGQRNEFNALYKKIEKKEESITGSGQEEDAVSDTEAVESENAVVEIPAQTEPPVESTTPISDLGSTETQISSEPILETPEGQETVNTDPVQPAIVPQEQQQNELSEQETIDDIPVAQSEETAIEENIEVVDNTQSESGD